MGNDGNVRNQVVMLRIRVGMLGIGATMRWIRVGMMGISVEIQDGNAGNQSGNAENKLK